MACLGLTSSSRRSSSLIGSLSRITGQQNEKVGSGLTGLALMEGCPAGENPQPSSS